MTGLSCSSGFQPSAVKAARPGDAPENLHELLGDTIPPVQALLMNLIKLDNLNEVNYTEGQLALVQKLAAAKTSDLGRLGRDELSDCIFVAAHILNATAALISRWRSPVNAHHVAALALLQPAPARAALLRLLAAMVRWEPSAQQLLAATSEEQGGDQPGIFNDNASASCSAAQGEPRVSAAAAAADEQERQPSQAAGYQARLALELLDLRKGLCQLVAQVLGPSRRSSREVEGYSCCCAWTSAARCCRRACCSASAASWPPRRRGC